MLRQSRTLLTLTALLLAAPAAPAEDARAPAKPPRRSDLQGDALPDGAVARLGTVLLRDAAAFRGGGHAPAKLSERERESLWQDLAGSDAAAALRAVCKLGGDPAGSPAFVRAKLRDLSIPTPEQVRAWLDELDSDSFRKRERAMQQLKQAGRAIEPVLHRARAANRSLEFQRRVTAILEALREQPVPAWLLQCQRAVQVLEAAGTPEARKALEEVGRRGVGEAAGALARLAGRVKPAE